MFELKRNISIYLVSNIAAAIVPFLLLPILTRYLGPEGYGVVAMFTTLITMLTPVIGLNAHNGLSKRWYDRDHINISEYVGSCIAILIFSTILVFLVFCLFQDWLIFKLGVPVFWLYTAIGVGFFAFLIQIRLVLWQVQEKPFEYGSMQFSLSFINSILSYLFIVYVLTSFEGRLWGYFFSVFIMGLWSFILLYKDGLLNFNIKWSYTRDALSIGAPLIPHVVGAIILLMADRIIVNIKLGASSAGVYMVAVQIALGYNLINESFNKAFLPKLYAILKSDVASEKISIVKMTYVYFSLLLIAPLCCIFLSKYLILILAGESFQEAAPVLNWLILGQSFHGMYYLVTNYLFYECKTYITSLITIICGLISLVLTLWLIDVFGLVGAGMGSAIGVLLQFLLTWIMAARIHPMPWFSFRSTTKWCTKDDVTY